MIEAALREGQAFFLIPAPYCCTNCAALSNKGWALGRGPVSLTMGCFPTRHCTETDLGLGSASFPTLGVGLLCPLLGTPKRICCPRISVHADNAGAAVLPTVRSRTAAARSPGRPRVTDFRLLPPPARLGNKFKPLPRHRLCPLVAPPSNTIIRPKKVWWMPAGMWPACMGLS